MDQQVKQVVLLEFWDFCRPNSLRTLDYLKIWHERYSDVGLRVIGVHCGGFEFGRNVEAVQAAVERLKIPYPIVVDLELEIWNMYGNEGWPARYLWAQGNRLFSMHYGEGAYSETELEIQQLLGLDRPLVHPLRPEDEPGAELAPQTPDFPGIFNGPYAAGSVWAIVTGAGVITVNGADRVISSPGGYPLVEHDSHTESDLSFSVSDGVECHATCFIPGIIREQGAEDI
jgi:hypothetical protein